MGAKIYLSVPFTGDESDDDDDCPNSRAHKGEKER